MRSRGWQGLLYGNTVLLYGLNELMCDQTTGARAYLYYLSTVMVNLNFCTTKLQEHALFGAHHKEVDMSLKATKKTFNDSDDE